ncbi:MAG: PAS domain-containing protein [Brasilonema octagenarum HA4186-MV1]|jgi:PAS domain S-box-containing protein|nr:PAS domain-containing protein [Brasilonema octagenarum HA4186-MV1]
MLPEHSLPKLPLPITDTNRLAVLHRYDILDTPPDAAFDDLTQLAAQICQTPVALITFVDADRQWLKSSFGVQMTELPLDIGFCPAIVQTGDSLIIPDTQANPEFATNLAVSDNGVRFYTGVPLTTSDGYVVGTLCVLDFVPRQMSEKQINGLRILSRQVMTQLELRLSARKVAQTNIALTAVSAGVATSVGETFLYSLVQHLSKALGVKYAYIGLLANHEPEVIEAIAVCADGRIVDNFEYLLRDTPCQEVIQQRKLCCYPHNVQQQFPDAPLLAPFQVESYAAIPFYDSTGAALGLLGVMDDKPLEAIALTESLLTIFAVRIATELERQLAETLLYDSQHRVQNLLANMPGMVYRYVPGVDGSSRFVFVNYGCYDLFEIEPQTALQDANSIWDLIHPEDLASFQVSVAYAIEHFLPWDWVGRVITPSGRLKWIQGRSSAEETLDGIAWDGWLIDITERKRVEAALGERDQQLKLALETSKLGSWQLDLKTNVLSVSNQCKMNFGVPLLSEFSHQILMQRIHPDDRAWVQAAIQDSIVNRTDYDVEYRTVWDDASIHWALVRGCPIYDRAGNPERMMGMSMDITARKQAEATLRESEARLQFVLDSCQIGEWDLDLTTQPYSARRSLRHDQIFGYDSLLPEWSYEIFLTYVHPDDRASVAQKFQHTLSTWADWDFECRIISSDGQLRWIWAKGSVYRDADNIPSRLLGVVVDFTERKQAQASLRESEELNHQILESSYDCIKVLDLDGKILYINSGGQRLLNICDMGCYLNSDWIQFWQGEDRQAAQAAIRAALSGGVGRFQGYCPTADGIPKWWEVMISPILDSTGEAERLLSISRDITDRIQFDIERDRILAQEQQARAEAERANRIKDEFLAVLSHELRTPLNPILGWSKLLQQGKLDAAKTANALATINRNAKLQVQLIDDLLDISRILRGKLSLTVTPVDLSTVICAALETVRLAAEAKSLQIQTTIPEAVGTVNGDAGRLQQVVWNLLTNAVKFTPAGGQIAVELTQVGSNAQIQVKDTGKGIGSDFLPYVFEHFRQEDGATTRKFGGLGLGLAIVRQIVEMHGGTVTVDSPGEGQGATFTVQIPLACQSNELPTPQQSSSHTGDLSGIRILVVDDEADSRQFVAFILEQANAIVTSVGSGIDALQAFSQSIPDIIVSDIGMPEMDGYMMMRQIRALPVEQGGQVPAIALTAYAAEVDQERAIAAGFLHHIAKPIDPDAVLAIVLNTTCVRKHRGVRGASAGVRQSGLGGFPHEELPKGFPDLRHLAL